MTRTAWTRPTWNRLRALGAALAGLSLLAACGGSAATSQGGSVTTLQMVAFQPPSLGDFLLPVIKDQGFDKKHGLDLQPQYRTPDAYNLEFASGDFPLGGSAAVLSEGIRWQRGVKTVYLFNEFDFSTYVVTKKSNIKTLKDLEGKSLGAPTVTTNYALFKWFAINGGVDMSKVKAVNLTTEGEISALESGQVDAIDITEPAYSTLLAQDPSVKTINIDRSLWKKKYGTTAVPFLGMGALPDWASSHKKEIQELYDTYKDAKDWAFAHPSEAAKVIAKTIPNGSAAVIETLLKHNDRLQLDLAPASKVKSGLEAVADAGVSMGYLKSKPGSSFIYSGLSES